jgi:hypothetical protein
MAKKAYLTEKHKEAIKRFKDMFGVGTEVKLKTPAKVIDDSGGFMSSGSNGYISAFRINPETKHIEYYLDFWCYGWHDGETEQGDYSNCFKDHGIKLIDRLIEQKQTEGAAKDLTEAKAIDRALDLDGDSNKRTLAYKQGLIPEDDFYLENEATFNLWKLRRSDKPISYKEMYTIVEVILKKIDHAETSASLAGWDGR